MHKADVANNEALKNVPITGFKNDKSLKNHRDACVSQGWYGKQTQTVWWEETSYFKRRETDETFNILKEPLNYSSNHVTYLFERKNVNVAFLV